MSALPPKADIAECDWHVRLVPEADISETQINLVSDRVPSGRNEPLAIDGQFKLCRLQHGNMLDGAGRETSQIKAKAKSKYRSNVEIA